MGCPEESVGGDGTGVADATDPLVPGGFEHVDRADHVDPGAADWICHAEGHLQGGEVDNRLTALCRLTDGLGIGDVADHPVNPGELVVRHQQCWPARLGVKIERRDVHAGAHQKRHRPGSDAAAGPGDQDVPRPRIAVYGKTLQHWSALPDDGTFARIMAPVEASATRRAIPPGSSGCSVHDHWLPVGVPLLGCGVDRLHDRHRRVGGFAEHTPNGGMRDGSAAPLRRLARRRKESVRTASVSQAGP